MIVNGLPNYWLTGHMI